MSLKKLRSIAAAYQAALEYGGCPDIETAKKYSKSFMTDFKESDFELGATNYVGHSPSDLVTEMIIEIVKLSEPKTPLLEKIIKAKKTTSIKEQWEEFEGEDGDVSLEDFEKENPYYCSLCDYWSDNVFCGCYAR